MSSYKTSMEYPEMVSASSSVSALDAYSSGLTETSLLSYMARLNYSYKGKYYLDVFTRWDGASQLAEGNKWDVFPCGITCMAHRQGRLFHKQI